VAGLRSMGGTLDDLFDVGVVGKLVPMTSIGAIVEQTCTSGSLVASRGEAECPAGRPSTSSPISAAQRISGQVAVKDCSLPFSSPA
jgi:hypothetical protein